MFSLLIRLLGACAVLSVAAAIFNGEDVKSISEFPYLVAVLDDGDNICGGSLIRLDVVLTAAHCVHGTPAKYLQVRAAALYRVDNGKDVQILPVLRNIVHEEYDSENDEHDIAILKTKGKFTKSTLIDTIDLPPLGADYDLKKGTVMGWGVMLNGKEAKLLQKATLPILGSARCAPFFATGTIFSTHYCNYDNTETKSFCNGDSGGPVAIHFKTKRDIIAGINSWVYTKNGQCCAEDPSVSTNVEKYLNWIKQYLNQFDAAGRNPNQNNGEQGSSIRPQNIRPSSPIRLNSPTRPHNNRPHLSSKPQNNRPNSPTRLQNNRSNSSNRQPNTRPNSADRH